MAGKLGRAAKDMSQKIAAQLQGAVASQLSEAYARRAATMIQKRTRSGLGVSSEGGSLQPLKPLSPAYIQARKRMKLSSFTSPGKSNLTRTSEMLGSLGVAKSSASVWTIKLFGRHESGITNEKLASYVSRERPFLFLARDEIILLQDFLSKEFSRLVKRSVRV